MSNRIVWLAAVLLAIHCSAPASAGPSARLLSQEAVAGFLIADASNREPFCIPSDDEILRELPANDRPKNAHIERKLILYRINTPRVYPGVGFARLVEVHFRCTVTSNGQTAVVYIDRDHLIAER